MTPWAVSAKQLIALFNKEDMRSDLFTRWHRCACAARATRGAEEAEMFAFGKLLTYILNLEVSLGA